MNKLHGVKEGEMITLSSDDGKNISRVGYCAWCKYNLDDTSLPEASKIEGHKCNGCWFTEDKPNWRMRK